MKRIVGLVVAILLTFTLLSPIFTMEVQASELEEREYLTTFFEGVENESEFLLMIQLLYLLENKEAITADYKALFDELEETEGSRFSELEESVTFLLDFSEVILKDKADYLALVKAIDEDLVDEYVESITEDEFKALTDSLNSSGYEIKDVCENVGQLNKLTDLLAKTASFKSYGISFPVVTISEDYEESQIDDKLLESLADLAGDMVSNGSGYDRMLESVVAAYHDYYEEASLRDQKVLAAYLYNYGLLTVE